jgi:hypothetical protein
MEIPIHAPARGFRREFRAEAIVARKSVAAWLEGDTHEESLCIEIGILLGIENEPVAIGKESSYGRDDADAVGARQSQHMARRRNQ